MSNTEIGILQTIDSSQYYLTYKNNFINLFKSDAVPSIIEVETISDVSKSLNNKYFTLSTWSKKYCVYFNVDNSSVGPQVSSSFSSIEISISENDNANTIASAIKTQLDLNYSDEFTTDIDGNLLTITTVNSGKPKYTILDANTGFTISVSQYGKDSFSLVKSEIPDDSLYDILDVSINNSGDLKILGIYKDSNKLFDEHNRPILNEEYYEKSKTYSNWVIV